MKFGANSSIPPAAAMISRRSGDDRHHRSLPAATYPPEEVQVKNVCGRHLPKKNANSPPFSGKFTVYWPGRRKLKNIQEFRSKYDVEVYLEPG
ncbi:hypothetical protein, partial [Chitinophaga sp.]|uniref:hypothetical protein n=1 Tax=Chitinophaga sp. TaxID=1869181 RepID=UPI00260A213C